MKKSTEYTSLDNFALLLNGQPKSGKTRLALSFPKPAILDCDRNLGGAIRNGVSEFLYEDPNVDEEGKALLPAQSWQKSMNFLKEAAQLPKEECQTIIIDGLSNLSNYLIGSLTGHSKLMVGGMQVMDLKLWQPFRDKMVQLISAGRASNKIFIVTSHESLETNETGAIIAYTPMIAGSLRQNIAGFFSDVWRCEAMTKGNKVTYNCRVQNRNLMQLGNSLAIEVPEFDFTDKTPQEVWEVLGKYLKTEK